MEATETKDKVVYEEGSFGEFLKKAQNIFGFSQGSLANKLKINRRTIQRYEADTFSPTMETLLKLSEAFQSKMNSVINKHGDQLKNMNLTNEGRKRKKHICDWAKTLAGMAEAEQIGDPLKYIKNKLECQAAWFRFVTDYLGLRPQL